MAPEARKPTPRRNLSRAARKRAQSRLQRRLRQVIDRVDWLDVALGAVLSKLLDALGGQVDITEIVKLVLDALIRMVYI